MKLLKVKQGLLEVDNFYLTSFFSDFAGRSNVIRDIKNKEIKIISNNSIERSFNHKEFVLEVEKENFNEFKQSDYCCIYLGNKSEKFGIREEFKDSQNKFWKIIKNDNYIQAYVSEDRYEYLNIGGIRIDGDVQYQGFEKFSQENFILKDYKVYSNPYVLLQNIPEESIIELYSEENKLLLTTKSDKNNECKIFLESKIKGYFKLKNMNGDITYTSNIIYLSYGDVYVLSKYELEVLYHGKVVNNDNPAMLDSFEELITIRNIGKRIYKDMIISTNSISQDLIQLSIDGINFNKTINIKKIDIKEIKNIFVRVTKSRKSENFGFKEFQLVIEE